MDAERLGKSDTRPCPNCGNRSGKKLNRLDLQHLAHRYFVVGSLQRADYGGAPVLEFNDLRTSDIDEGKRHSRDAALISRAAGIGLFYYGPPLWRFGYIEPLQELRNPVRRRSTIQRIVEEYPAVNWPEEQRFYRLRKDVALPGEPMQYDSPPLEFCGSGRLDTRRLPILYGSADLEVCVHECRATADDNIFFATLQPTRTLRLLDLTAVLKENVTAFESLDLAVHMTFMAGKHSYGITRAIAAAAKARGFDGVLFPSYFSLLRTGSPFLESAYGLPVRRIDGAESYELSKIVPNVALFGRPIADGLVVATSLNRLYIRRVAYDLGFGPVET